MGRSPVRRGPGRSRRAASSTPRWPGVELLSLIGLLQVIGGSTAPVRAGATGLGDDAIVNGRLFTLPITRVGSPPFLRRAGAPTRSGAGPGPIPPVREPFAGRRRLHGHGRAGL